MALDLVDPLKDAARVVRDIRRAVFREAAEKAGRRRSHNDEAKERDAPHGPPQMLPGAAHWIGSPEQLPAGGGLPVDRTCLLEGGLYVSSCARRCGQNWAPRAAFFGNFQKKNIQVIRVFRCALPGPDLLRVIPRAS